jgi:hypothetical protein
MLPFQRKLSPRYFDKVVIKGTVIYRSVIRQVHCWHRKISRSSMQFMIGVKVNNIQ